MPLFACYSRVDIPRDLKKYKRRDLEKKYLRIVTDYSHESSRTSCEVLLKECSIQNTKSLISLGYYGLLNNQLTVLNKSNLLQMFLIMSKVREYNSLLVYKSGILKILFKYAMVLKKGRRYCFNKNIPQSEVIRFSEYVVHVLEEFSNYNSFDQLIADGVPPGVKKLCQEAKSIKSKLIKKGVKFTMDSWETPYHRNVSMNTIGGSNDMIVVKTFPEKLRELQNDLSSVEVQMTELGLFEQEGQAEESVISELISSLSLYEYRAQNLIQESVDAEQMEHYDDTVNLLDYIKHLINLLKTKICISLDPNYIETNLSEAQELEHFVALSSGVEHHESNAEESNIEMNLEQQEDEGEQSEASTEFFDSASDEEEVEEEQEGSVEVVVEEELEHEEDRRYREETEIETEMVELERDMEKVEVEELEEEKLDLLDTYKLLDYQDSSDNTQTNVNRSLISTVDELVSLKSERLPTEELDVDTEHLDGKHVVFGKVVVKYEEESESEEEEEEEEETESEEESDEASEVEEDEEELEEELEDEYRRYREERETEKVELERDMEKVEVEELEEVLEEEDELDEELVEEEDDDTFTDKKDLDLFVDEYSESTRVGQKSSSDSFRAEQMASSEKSLSREELDEEKLFWRAEEKDLSEKTSLFSGLDKSSELLLGKEIAQELEEVREEYREEKEKEEREYKELEERETEKTKEKSERKEKKLEVKFKDVEEVVDREDEERETETKEKKREDDESVRELYNDMSYVMDTLKRINNYLESRPPRFVANSKNYQNLQLSSPFRSLSLDSEYREEREYKELEGRELDREREEYREKYNKDTQMSTQGLERVRLTDKSVSRGELQTRKIESEVESELGEQFLEKERQLKQQLFGNIDDNLFRRISSIYLPRKNLPMTSTVLPYDNSLVTSSIASSKQFSGYNITNNYYTTTTNSPRNYYNTTHSHSYGPSTSYYNTTHSHSYGSTHNYYNATSYPTNYNQSSGGSFNYYYAYDDSNITQMYDNEMTDEKGIHRESNKGVVVFKKGIPSDNLRNRMLANYERVEYYEKYEQEDKEYRERTEKELENREYKELEDREVDRETERENRRYREEYDRDQEFNTKSSVVLEPTSELKQLNKLTKLLSLDTTASNNNESAKDSERNVEVDREDELEEDKETELEEKNKEENEKTKEKSERKDKRETKTNKEREDIKYRDEMSTDENGYPVIDLSEFENLEREGSDRSSRRVENEETESLEREREYEEEVEESDREEDRRYREETDLEREERETEKTKEKERREKYRDVEHSDRKHRKHRDLREDRDRKYREEREERKYREYYREDSERGDRYYDDYYRSPVRYGYPRNESYYVVEPNSSNEAMSREDRRYRDEEDEYRRYREERENRRYRDDRYNPEMTHREEYEDRKYRESDLDREDDRERKVGKYREERSHRERRETEREYKESEKREYMKKSKMNDANLTPRTTFRTTFRSESVASNRTEDGKYREERESDREDQVVNDRRFREEQQEKEYRRYREQEETDREYEEEVDRRYRDERGENIDSTTNSNVVKNIIKYGGDLIYEDKMMTVRFTQSPVYHPGNSSYMQTEHNYTMSTENVLTIENNSLFSYSLSFDYSNFENFPLDVKFLNKNFTGVELVPGQKMSHRFSAHCFGPFVGLPKLTLTAHIDVQTDKVFQVYLPLAVSCFFTPSMDMFRLSKSYFSSDKFKHIMRNKVYFNAPKRMSLGQVMAIVTGFGKFKLLQQSESCYYLASSFSAPFYFGTKELYRFTIFAMVEVSTSHYHVHVSSDSYRLANSTSMLLKYILQN